MKNQVNADGVVLEEQKKGSGSDEEKLVEKKVLSNTFYKPLPKTDYKTKPTNSGQPFTVRPKLSFGTDGTKRAEPGEKFDLDGMIQASKDSTDIAAIVARYQAGDESVLHVNPGFIGDAVTLPKDIYDVKAMNDLYDKVSGSFETLPDDIKALFNNSVEEYLNSIIANKANETIEKYKASLAKPEEKPQETSAEGGK